MYSVNKYLSILFYLSIINISIMYMICVCTLYFIDKLNININIITLKIFELYIGYVIPDP